MTHVYLLVPSPFLSIIISVCIFIHVCSKYRSNFRCKGDLVLGARSTPPPPPPDELPFQKGDILILKGHINQEWYICTKGDQTGIVPAIFVRLIDQT